MQLIALPVHSDPSTHILHIYAISCKHFLIKFAVKTRNITLYAWRNKNQYLKLAKMNDTKVKQITHASCMISYASMTDQRQWNNRSNKNLYLRGHIWECNYHMCWVTIFEKNNKLKPTCAASGICLVMLHVANSSPH